jgi:biopolymer transport protein ExbB/TolQ
VKPQELQTIVTVSIAVASVVVVPALVAIGKRLFRAWREAHQAHLSKMFVVREEWEQKFADMQAQQAQQHAENREFMDTIRTEAHRREGKILASIEAVSNQHRQESQRLGTDIARVAARVDRVFERMAGGRT